MTPQPLAPTPAQPSWFSKNWPFVVGGGCLLLLCCGVFGVVIAGGVAAELQKEGAEPVRVTPAAAARVDCGTPGPSGVDCEIKRTGGTGALSACWTLEIACANGGTMSAEACGSLGTGDRATVNLPVASFSNQEACDAPRQGTVKDLIVTED